MAKQTTIQFEVPYKAQDGTIQTRKFNLSLSIDACLSEGEENPGDVNINGAVMPVDDPRGGSPAPATQEGELDEQKAA